MVKNNKNYNKINGFSTSPEVKKAANFYALTRVVVFESQKQTYVLLNKSVLMAIPIIAMIVGTMTISSVHASTIGNFGAGYDQGKSDALNDYSESCPYDFTSNVAYCTGYHAGYAEESAALNAAQP